MLKWRELQTMSLPLQSKNCSVECFSISDNVPRLPLLSLRVECIENPKKETFLPVISAVWRDKFCLWWAPNGPRVNNFWLDLKIVLQRWSFKLRVCLQTPYQSSLQSVSVYTASQLKEPFSRGWKDCKVDHARSCVSSSLPRVTYILLRLVSGELHKGPELFDHVQWWWKNDWISVRCDCV